MPPTNLLERFLNPVATALSPEVAQRIIDTKPDAELVARVEELGRKSSDGTLTDEEREEYRALVNAGDLIATLKLKAQDSLDHES